MTQTSDGGDAPRPDGPVADVHPAGGAGLWPGDPVVRPSTAPRPAGPAPSGEGARGLAPRRRRLLLVGAAVLAVVVIVVAVLIAVLGSRGDREPAALPGETVTAPLPTPAVEPVAKESGTAFFDALPATVLQFALAEAQAADLGAGALEGHRLVYTDGADSTVVVQAGQWRTPEAAAAQRDAWVAAAAGEQSATGEVGVGDAVTGTYTIVVQPDGQAVATWSNGTAVIQATGAVGDIERFYAAYPL